MFGQNYDGLEMSLSELERDKGLDLKKQSNQDLPRDEKEYLKYKGILERKELDNNDVEDHEIQFSNERIRDSNVRITKELDKATRMQDQRINDEIIKNAAYKNELEHLKKQAKEKELTAFDKEKIRRQQIEREKKLVEEKMSDSPSKQGYDLDSKEKELIRKYQQLRGEEVYEERYAKSKNDEEDSLTESRKTHVSELASTLKESSNMYRKKLMGGFESLEQKINKLEKDLDNRLSGDYISNRELLKREKNKNNEEQEDDVNEEAEEEQGDEEEEELSSESEDLKPKKNHKDEKAIKSSDEFRKAMQKKQKIIEDDNRKNEIDNKNIPNQSSSKRSRPQTAQGGTKKNSLFEAELEKIREENDLIKRELNEIKKKNLIIKNAEEPKLSNYGSKLIPVENSNMENQVCRTAAELELLKKRKELNSDMALREIIKDDEVINTVNKTKNKIRANLQENQRKRVVKSQKKIPFDKSPQKQEKTRGIKDEIQLKYYGCIGFCPSCTLLLNRGLPTSHCSEHGKFVEPKDPKKKFPKRFEKYL